MTAIVSTELKFYTTTDGLGGAITATEVINGDLHNTFDQVTAAEALSGVTQYYCIYTKNTNVVQTLQDAFIYLTSNTPSEDTEFAIGLGTSPVNGTEQTILSNTTAPADITFTVELDEDGVLVIGDMPTGTSKAIWLRRVVSANAVAYSNDGASLSFQGVTGA